MGSISDKLCPKCGGYNGTEDVHCGKCMSKSAASESAVTTDLLRQGMDVALPSRDNSQYDLVVRGISGIWYSVQVKTAYLTGDKLQVNVCRTNSTGSRGYSPLEVDLFAAVDGDKIWYIPFEQLRGRQRLSLMTKESKGWLGDANICI